MTGRLPCGTVCLVPPMYGMPGGLSGEVTLPQLLSEAGYVTQAVGKWHMGENEESQPQNVGFDDFYGFLSVSDMYTEWRDPYFFPEVVYSEDRTRMGREHPFQQVLRPCRTQRAARRGRRGRPFPCSPCSTTSGAPTRSSSSSAWSAHRRSWFLYHCTRGAHFDNYPHPDFLGRSPARHPYKDAIVELDAICGRLVAALERTGQLDSTMVVISSDNGPEMETWPDSAFTPFRCAKGSTWEGGVRVPAVVTWPGMIEPGRVSDGLVHLLDLFATCLSMADTDPSVPSDRYIDAVDQLSFLLAPDDRETVSNRKFQHYWLTGTHSALRVGEYKYMMSSISDDDTDVHNPGGFTGVVQRYGYGRLYNLYLDPKETRSYMIRKLVYIDAIIEEIGRHGATFRQWPNKPSPADTR